MDKEIFLTIVIPMFNEARRIAPFLNDIAKYVNRCTFSCEILLVDDGSTDKTIPRIKNLFEQHVPGRYRIEQLEHNQGKGSALRTGMLAARERYILFLDADGSTAITELDNFIPAFSADHEIYIAVRTKKHAEPLKRKFFGSGYIFLANCILGMGLSDFTCGFKCYSLQAARTIFSRHRLNNWSFDAEFYLSPKNQTTGSRKFPCTGNMSEIQRYGFSKMLSCAESTYSIYASMDCSAATAKNDLLKTNRYPPARACPYQPRTLALLMLPTSPQFIR